MLKDAQRRFGFSIQEVDIDGDPDLVAKYDTEVPVVAVDGKVRFRGVVNPALWSGCSLRSRARPGSPELVTRIGRSKRDRLLEHAPHRDELTGVHQGVDAGHVQGVGHGGNPCRGACRRECRPDRRRARLSITAFKAARCAS